MIAKGHLTAVSIRAQGDKVVPRRDLPNDHPASVTDDEPNLAKRFGLFFERFTPLEGSIVALGADKQAIIGRSLDAAVHDFWETFLDEEDREPTVAPSPASEVSQIVDLRSLERFLRDAGASRSEAKRIIALVKPDPLPKDPPRDVVRKPTVRSLERDARALLRSELEGLKTEIYQECRQLLAATLGRVNHE